MKLKDFRQFKGFVKKKKFFHKIFYVDHQDSHIQID